VFKFSIFFQQLSIYIDGLELGQKVHANFFFSFSLINSDNQNKHLQHGEKEKAPAIMLQASYQMLNQQQKNDTTLTNLIRESLSP